MYIGVLSQGGIITDVVTDTNLDNLEKSMYILCPEEDFNPECDDMRIFNDNNEEVKVLHTDLTDAVFK